MQDSEIIQKLADLKELVDDLCSPGDAAPDLKEAVERLRRAQKLAKEVELELLNRVLANVDEEEAR